MGELVLVKPINVPEGKNKDQKYPLLVLLSIFLLSITLFFGPLGCTNTSRPFDDEDIIFNVIDEEFLDVKENINFAKKNKDTVWGPDDFAFYSLWLKGIEKEKEGKYEDAIRFYEQAYKSGRYEMSSYAVLLPLGRTYVLSGEKDKAIFSLKKFIKEAERELLSISMWELTPEGEEALRKDMEHAKWLMSLCK